MNKTRTDSIAVNSITGAKSQAWSFLKIGGNATLNGTIHVTYNSSTWTPKEGDYVRVLVCAGTVSGEPVFDLQELPAGLYWDTTELFTKGIISVTNTVGITNIDAGAMLSADVYTVAGVKVATNVMTTKVTLKKDLKSLGLGTGIYIIRIGGKSMKVSLD